MELVRLLTPSDATTEAVRSRSRCSSKSSLTQHFGYWEGGQEVALLSLDIYSRDEFPEVDYLPIYELFVPEPLRNRGVGTRMLSQAEEYARKLGFRKTTIYAKPLFESRTQEEMVSWYQRRGYVLIEGTKDHLEKTL